MADKEKFETFSQTEWCIKKAQDAAKDFDIEGINKYLDMARLWLGHMREACRDPDKED